MTDTASTQTTGPGGLTLGETLGLVFIAGPLIGGVTLAATSARTRLLGWLLDHGILLQAPLLAVPGAGGAGLDLPRLLIAAGFAGLALTVAVSVVRRRADKPAPTR